MRPLVLLIALAACNGDDKDATGTDGATDGPTDTTEPTGDGIGDLACAPSQHTDAVLVCTFTSAEAGEGWVEVTADGASWSTPPTASGTTHEVALIGLKAGEAYDAVAYVDAASGQLSSAPLPVQTTPPSWAPSTTVTGAPTHPYVATARIDKVNGYPVVFDAEGDMVWWYDVGPERLITSIRRSLDGRDLLFISIDYNLTGDDTYVVRVALDGSAVTSTRAYLGHHDFQELDTGEIAFIGYTYGQFGGDEWVTDAIRVVPEGTSDTTTYTELFSYFDDYPHDPWQADPQLAGEFVLGDADFEWTHSNSLMRTDGQHWYLMSKFLDNILKIDLQGNVVWQMGGQYSDFTMSDGTPMWTAIDTHQQWSHAHMSHFWDGGLLVFDNGYTTGDGGEDLSRVVEYAYDEGTMEVTEVWSYVEPTGEFTGVMGDARKLDNDNVLIGWADLSYISEVDPSGNEVWRMEIAGAIPSRVDPFDDLYAGYR